MMHTISLKLNVIQKKKEVFGKYFVYRKDCNSTVLSCSVNMRTIITNIEKKITQLSQHERYLDEFSQNYPQLNDIKRLYSYFLP